MITTLKGKKAIVTGGGRGLGKAVALQLAREGVHVGITGRNEENLKATLAELHNIGVNAAYAVFDVANEAAVQEGVKKLAEKLAGVDILINNAGVGDFGKITDMPSTQWEDVIRVNLFGVYYVAKAVYPFLKDKGEGDIVNVASTAGLKGGANMSAYAASKAAVVSLSQSMMAEWRKENIRVITLTPSTIASDMSIQGGLTDGNPESVLQPEDFAQWVCDMLRMNRRALVANASLFSNNP
ncbi:3-ketoacyl-ACP reductase [Sphingobacterium alkalisoli]|uniref:3-ketoacyl-ACP reductase n=1 Tax=Sphingobacterium alkalisoli TaxID=1874115 RepID=A0A4U0H9P5_9SPHI|nr:3-ketoacyl-ACP reductase [Sphingobacterium alkalisoli]TJY68114.1 3-ketoacyl-ACP reductase [Sphingobacterium alkalisoli]GGH08975.1 putative oxidoreductase YoxD [Sphingobacterium alkalisoli]